MPSPLAIAGALLGGFSGLRQAKQSGASGLGALLGGALGAYGGYNLAGLLPGVSAPSVTSLMSGATAPQMGFMGSPAAGGQSFVQKAAMEAATKQAKERSMLDLLLKSKKTGEYSPGKIAGLTALASFGLGAFDQGPADVYAPTYNMGVLDLAENRPQFTYIDPTTGQEKEYERMYKPEEAAIGKPRIGNMAYEKVRLKTGGLAEIKKFNEGGINYLPSKMTHDENDANNYVRASGYVEDGAGVGDKDEDTMLAQLADGEFVTRADGVLGAGIIAGANPNSMKDMREKGAKYFYEQQARYKRVFDLLKEKNGEGKQKTN